MIAVEIREGCVEIVRRRKPQRRRGWSVVRLLCAGICNTDIELRRGYYGFRGIPGHEFAGEVVESDDRNLLGKRVVGEINIPCRKCDWCRRGLGRHCPRRTVLGIVRHPGAFAEYLLMPDENLHVIPASLPTDQATFTEPVAAACEILDQIHVRRGVPAAVLGDGKLGLLIAQVLRCHGVDVHLFGKHKEKLAIAQSLGIRTRLSSAEVARPEFDLVVDATGSQDGLIQALSLTRPRGTVVLKSTVHGRVQLDTAPVIVNEITLIGSRCGRFEPALRLLRSGSIEVEPLISARLPLSKATQGFDLAEQRGTLKVLLHA
jgi:threonine dehydrogenase-like Zn-dependent dehydrogenase